MAHKSVMYAMVVNRGGEPPEGCCTRNVLRQYSQTGANVIVQVHHQRGVVVIQVCVMRLVLQYSVVSSACAPLSRFTKYSRQIASAKREQNA